MDISAVFYFIAKKFLVNSFRAGFDKKTAMLPLERKTGFIFKSEAFYRLPKARKPFTLFPQLINKTENSIRGLLSFALEL